MGQILNQRLGHPHQIVRGPRRRTVLLKAGLQRQVVRTAHHDRNLLQHKRRTVPWFDPKQPLSAYPALAFSECADAYCLVLQPRTLIHPNP
ncbi:hypothetical protein D3C84_1140220 [compost metagenome]